MTPTAATLEPRKPRRPAWDRPDTWPQPVGVMTKAWEKRSIPPGLTMLSRRFRAGDMSDYIAFLRACPARPSEVCLVHHPKWSWVLVAKFKADRSANYRPRIVPTAKRERGAA